MLITRTVVAVTATALLGAGSAAAVSGLPYRGDTALSARQGSGIPPRPLPHGTGLTTTASPPPAAAPRTTTSTAAATTTTIPPAVHSAQLVAYPGCPQMLSGVEAQALDDVGPYGLSDPYLEGIGQGPASRAPGAVAAPSAPVGSGTASPESGGASTGSGAAPSQAGGASPSASPSAGAAAGATESGGPAASPLYSGTNDQEAGVDEPDVVKTDGHLLLALRPSQTSPPRLEIADVSGASPHMDAALDLPQLSQVSWSSDMLLSGTYAVVLGQGPWSPDEGRPPSTEAVVVNLADPGHPYVARTFTLDGQEAGARLVGGKVVVVLDKQPSLPFGPPQGSDPQAQAQATHQNQTVVRSSKLTDWIPSVTVSPSGITWTPSCQTVFHPQQPAGLGTVAVVTLDPARDRPISGAAVVGDALTVYASTTRVYVATTGGGVPFATPVAASPAPGGGASAGPGVSAGSGAVLPAQPAGEGETDIAGFDLSDPASVRYIGSGAVPGSLIGQYAMSEYKGDLRVATTVGFASPAPNDGAAPEQLSDNRVTVLAEQGGALVPVGLLGGLGQGEKIYGVRFVGPIGYVVTFRQTDPLYTVDLSDPTHPKLDGQLALTGFSSFLQPLSGSLLLGVGEAVDANLRPEGLQLSVFDVGNPQSPVLRSRLNLDESESAAQNDPHALLWWPARDLVVMPLSDSSSSPPFDGFAVWGLTADGTLQPVARLAQSAGYDPVERAVVVGDLLYTVSVQGIMATDMNSWKQAAWLPLG